MSNIACCDNAFCNSLPPGLRSELCCQKTSLILKRRQTFILDAGKVMIVKRGAVIPCLLRADGDEKGIKLLGEGAMLGVAQLFSKLERAFSVHVVEHFEGCIIDKKNIEEKCVSSTEFSRSVIQQLAHHLAISSLNMEDRAHCESPEKIMLILERSFNDIHKEFKLTHEEIALLIGVNRVTVSRAIANIQPS